MKKILLLFSLITCALVQSMQAQELQVTGIKWLTNDPYAQRHPRYDNNDELCAVIKISVAHPERFTVPASQRKDSIEYRKGELIVWVPGGTRFLRLQSDEMGFIDVNFRDPEFIKDFGTIKIESGNTYELDLKLVIAERRRLLVMGEVGFHPSQSSFGVMVGMVAKTGAYLRVRSNLKSVSTSLECDDTGMLSTGAMPYYKEGVNKKARLSFTGGYLHRIAKPLYAYVGAGYGYRTLAWETTDGELAENTDHSANGVAAEIGLIGQHKQFALSLGCQTINFKYMEFSIGIGYMF